eukprot:m.295622 g.295622  ORF g.295622 m.295622 type:complete len:472 (+) comp13230_c0_seq1:48-1463(+)
MSVAAIALLLVVLAAAAVQGDPHLGKRTLFHTWKSPFGASEVPQQVHVAVGRNATSYVVSWVSFEPLSPSLRSLVEYGSSPDSLTRQAESTPFEYTDVFTCPNVTRMIHNVEIDTQGLGSSIAYRVSSAGSGKTRSFTLQVPPSGSEPMLLSVYGDMAQMSYDNRTDTCIPLLNSLTQQKQQHLIVHYGDIAYDLEDDCGKVGDAFLHDLEPTAAAIPVMFSPGNHEDEAPIFSYSQYKNRFSGQQPAGDASGSHSVRWYSFDRGLVHFVVIDTDAWVYEPVFHLAKQQALWLEQDLKSVDRTKTPWVLAFGHRAMYCTKSEDEECHGEAESIRNGGFFPGVGTDAGIEPLLLKYGVEMYFAGHTHHYERTYPVARGSAVGKSYVNVKGVVHIQSGIAGGDGQDDFVVPQEPWEAFRDTKVVDNNGVKGYRRGIVRLAIHNSTTLSLSQVDLNGNEYDAMVLVHDTHGGPF